MRRKGKKTLAQKRKGKTCKNGFRKGSAKCRKTKKRRK